MIFRFDDVCINSDMVLLNDITSYLFDTFPNSTVLWGISPLVHDMSVNTSSITKQRIFPKILNAYSDYRVFYKVEKLGIPTIPPNVVPASHGLIHVDHRLLTKEAQEMSILISTNLSNSKIFIPPFNKWNRDTEEICKENNIELIKFEEGWLCMEYNMFNREQEKWYLHARAFTYKTFVDWFKI